MDMENLTGIFRKSQRVTGVHTHGPSRSTNTSPGTLWDTLYHADVHAHRHTHGDKQLHLYLSPSLTSRLQAPLGVAL